MSIHGTTHDHLENLSGMAMRKSQLQITKAALKASLQIINRAIHVITH